MLSQPAVIAAVAAGLDRHGARNVVLDPVMVAASGDALLVPEAVETLRRVLVPQGAPRHAEPAGGGGAARRGRGAGPRPPCWARPSESAHSARAPC